MVPRLISLLHCLFAQPYPHLQGDACNMASSLAASLQTSGFEMLHATDVVPLLDMEGVVDAWTNRLHCAGPGSLDWPRVAPFHSKSGCVMQPWFKTFSLHKKEYQLPVSGRMQFCLRAHATFFAVCSWVVMPCQLLLGVG